jgi:hypothetical protein
MLAGFYMHHVKIATQIGLECSVKSSRWGEFFKICSTDFVENDQ